MFLDRYTIISIL